MTARLRRMAEDEIARIEAWADTATRQWRQLIDDISQVVPESAPTSFHVGRPPYAAPNGQTATQPDPPEEVER